MRQFRKSTGLGVDRNNGTTYLPLPLPLAGPDTAASSSSSLLPLLLAPTSDAAMAAAPFTKADEAEDLRGASPLPSTTAWAWDDGCCCSMVGTRGDSILALCVVCVSPPL